MAAFRRPRLIAALLALLACAAPFVRATPAEPVSLNITVIPADSSAQVFYAQELGFFKNAGLDVHVSRLGNSPAIIAGVVSGSIDIGNSVVGSAVAARSRGIPVQFFAPAGLYLAAEPTAYLMAGKDSPMKTAADLAGKTIAVTGLADLTYYATKEWLTQSCGGCANSAKFVELPLPEMAGALVQHRVDAAVMIEPFATAAGDVARPIGTPDDSIAKRFLATGWLASDAWLKAHPDVAQRFAEVMRQTADWANGHRKESAQILLRNLKLAPEVAAKMQRATYGTTLEPSLLQPVIDNAQKYGGIERPVSASALIWTPPR